VNAVQERRQGDSSVGAGDGTIVEAAGVTSALARHFSLPKEKGESQEDSGRRYREAVREVAGERLWRGTEVSCLSGASSSSSAALLQGRRKGRRVKKKKRRRSGLLGQENGPHRAGPSKEKHAINFEKEKTC
jgi:hypothetical protein